MIQLSKQDIEKLRNVGSGKFGTVYQKDDSTAYKIYHDIIYDDYGYPHSNPALKRSSQKRIYKLIYRSRSLIYTDGPKDFISIDGRFGGIVLPFYDGSNLVSLIDSNFSLKMDTSLKLVRNSKELTDHLIYPLDYKLNNILLQDGEVRIVDLDDVLTHVCIVPNIHYQRECVYGLNDTIRTLFGEFRYPPYGKEVLEQLTRSRGSTTYQYQDIDDYLRVKGQEMDFLLVDEESDLSVVRDLLDHYPFHVVYRYFKRLYNQDEYYLHIIEQFKNAGIPIFDMIYNIDNPNFYFQNYNCRNMCEVEGKQIIKK